MRAVLTVVLALLLPKLAEAGCNLIPGATRTFAGDLGTLNRPFSAPGEPVEVAVRSCDATYPGLGATGPDHVVVVAIKPAAGGAGKLKAVATNCAGITGACSGAMACQQVTAAELEVVRRDGVPHLRFPFPDTDAEQLPDGDGHTLAGPAAIAVLPVGQPLPCGLASATCASQSGLTACVDTLYFDDGGCGQALAHPAFPSFTALPRPNDYKSACFDTKPPCDPTATNVRLAVDAAGNLLIPTNWTGVLAATAAPVPRELTVHIQPPAPVAAIPSQVFLASYTPEGALLPPIFEPQAAPTPLPNTLRLFGSTDAPYTVLRVARNRGACAAQAPNPGAPCTGRQDCAGADCDTVCVGGGNDGAACGSASVCPGGTCGTLFDFASLAGSGAVVVSRLGPGICQQAPHADCNTNGDCPGGAGDPCVLYALEAGAAHDLNGVVATDESLGFVVSEFVQAGDLNGDADPVGFGDDVIVLRDRETGEVQPIGNPVPCDGNQSPEPAGRATVTLTEPPFEFHAVAGEGDVVAFLESERDENECDQTGDGDAEDAILRVYRLGPTEITAGMDLATDPGLVINGRSLAVSNQRVFFRRPEQAKGVATTTWASIDGSGNGGDATSAAVGGTGRKISHDGRIVVFRTFSTNLAPGLAGGGNVIARNVATGTTEVVDKNQGGTPVGGAWEAISGNGKFVGFLSNQAVLPGATGQGRAYVRDLDNDVTELVSVSSNETPSDSATVENLNLSYDGRYVVFADPGTNLAAPCTSGVRHIFVRDRQLGTTVCVSVSSDGTEGDGDSDFPQISDDGRIIAFQSVANNLVTDDVNMQTNFGYADIFVHDRDADGDGIFDETHAGARSTRLVNRSTSGVQFTGLMFYPFLSGDGRQVAWDLYDGTYCPNGSCVGVKDIVTGAFESAVPDATGLTVPFGYTAGGGLSYDGRYLGLYSNAADVAPGDANNVDDVFILDRLTGVARWVSATDAGGSTGVRSYVPWISGDGRSIMFTAWGAIDADDTVSTCNPSQATNCDGGANDGAPCTLSSECPGGLCQEIFDDNCPDVYVHRIGPSEDCGDSVVDADEDCDPPGVSAVACGGELCSFTCHCADNDADLTGDETLNQTILEVVDARQGMTEGDLTPLCPAGRVVVAGGTAVFLRPEAGGNFGSCPALGVSLNPADADLLDDVVHVSVLGGTPENLERAAAELALGATCSTEGNACSQDSDCPNPQTCRPPYVAALVSEPQQGATPLNGDGDALDTVLNVYDLVGESWQTIPSVQAADAVDMKGILAVFTTPEGSQGALGVGPLNGDGDSNDRVLRMWDAATSTMTDLQTAAEDFVLGAPEFIDCGSGPELHQVIAFRTSEAAQGAILNGDGDMLDSVIYLVDYDLDTHTGTLIDKEMSVVPCPLEACDPRLPYRVSGKSVRFLTREQHQNGLDLNGDGDATDLILHTVDVCTGALTPIAAVDESIDDEPELTGNDPLADPADDDSSVSVVDGARCLQGSTLLLVPATCVTDDDCPAGSTCTADQVVVATPVEDYDFDGVPDGVDNCPLGPLFLSDQGDADNDGVGNPCDAIQACGGVPLPDCRTPVEPLKSMLQIKNYADDTKDSIQWTWRKGEATTLGDFGDPLDTNGGEGYALCLYDESGIDPDLIFVGTADNGGICANGKPCWKASGTTGYQYKNMDATPLGLTQLKIKAGFAGKAQATVKGKGANLVLPQLPLPGAVRVQLVAANGQCWEAVHDYVVKNDGVQLKLKDGP